MENGRADFKFAETQRACSPREGSTCRRGSKREKGKRKWRVARLQRRPQSSRPGCRLQMGASRQPTERRMRAARYPWEKRRRRRLRMRKKSLRLAVSLRTATHPVPIRFLNSLEESEARIGVPPRSEQHPHRRCDRRTARRGWRDVACLHGERQTRR